MKSIKLDFHTFIIGTEKKRAVKIEEIRHSLVQQGNLSFRSYLKCNWIA
ncbi:Hypothetical protein Minf_1194 [Methylacidiphilum infernorum V4]|uniref:Uncharacterized protein n=1 Tax=Methylacidiphilum infernorum (isolate V4) TaxID=481448 RepID=B3DV96_METI4|nr:Hypothetical protein Minf_1194 [Methylacidiphilum infernorum V4]